MYVKNRIIFLQYQSWIMNIIEKYFNPLNAY